MNSVWHSWGGLLARTLNLANDLSAMKGDQECACRSSGLIKH